MQSRWAPGLSLGQLRAGKSITLERKPTTSTDRRARRRSQGGRSALFRTADADGGDAVGRRDLIMHVRRIRPTRPRRCRTCRWSAEDDGIVFMQMSTMEKLARAAAERPAREQGDHPCDRREVDRQKIVGAGFARVAHAVFPVAVAAALTKARIVTRTIPRWRRSCSRSGLPDGFDHRDLRVPRGNQTEAISTPAAGRHGARSSLSLVRGGCAMPSGPARLH